MLLAIDTATRYASLALYGEDGVHAETTWRSRENHTVELMAQIVRLLAIDKLSKSDVRAIGIALGPGSFTGLRVGMSVAKGLALGSRAALVGIPTLDAVALVHALQPLPVWAIVAAGRGRYSVAQYVQESGSVRRVSDYHLVNAASFADLAERASSAAGPREARSLFSGEIDAALAQALAARLGERAVFALPAMNVRRAAFLGQLAWGRWQRGQVDDTASLAPMYAPHEIL